MATLEAVLVTVTQTSRHILFVPDAVTTTGMGDVTEVTRLEMIHRVVRGTIRGMTGTIVVTDRQAIRLVVVMVISRTSVITVTRGGAGARAISRQARATRRHRVVAVHGLPITNTGSNLKSMMDSRR